MRFIEGVLFSWIQEVSVIPSKHPFSGASWTSCSWEGSETGIPPEVGRTNHGLNQRWERRWRKNIGLETNLTFFDISLQQQQWVPTLQGPWEMETWYQLTFGQHDCRNVNCQIGSHISRLNLQSQIKTLNDAMGVVLQVAQKLERHQQNAEVQSKETEVCVFGKFLLQLFFTEGFNCQI